MLSNQEYLQKRVGQLGQLAEVIAAEPADSRVREAWNQLGGEALIEDMSQATSDLAEGVGRIREIVFDLRGLARTGDAPVLVDLNDALRSALRVAGAQLRGRKMVTDLGEHAVAMGSTGRLSQVFLNLLVNAAQAIADRGDALGEIQVSTRRDGPSVVAEIVNNGPLIQPEHLPRLFEPFFTTKGPGVGTGLGLSTSRDIIRRLGGEIRVESSAERGTRFTVVLPAASAADISAATANDSRGHKVPI